MGSLWAYLEVMHSRHGSDINKVYSWSVFLYVWCFRSFPYADDNDDWALWLTFHIVTTKHIWSQLAPTKSISMSFLVSWSDSIPAPVDVEEDDNDDGSEDVGEDDGDGDEDILAELSDDD